jgi:hypothetical protein
LNSASPEIINVDFDTTGDHILCIHQILGKRWEYKAEHQLFIDFMKAYDFSIVKITVHTVHCIQISKMYNTY